MKFPKHLLTKSPLQTFGIMMLAALVFGLCSYNLFFLLKANLALVIDYGFMALADGAFLELVMLVAYGVISLAAYIVFKACEKWLAEKLLK
ncbi:MAG: hypothetical protein B7X02_00510 [Rhodospirillales bacterium 12-54-5]|nr:MAG: hypothetical protein B7X02_00510 [Rhodospirillales bacterium 12-54-5]